jgi:predicted DNA-binding transcriptional regulator YafY
MPIARMKFIYDAIKTERRPNCSVLAKRLEISAKTIQRDIDYMRYQFDLPIEYDQERHGWGDAVEVVSPINLRDKVRASHQRAAVRNR